MRRALTAVITALLAVLSISATASGDWLPGNWSVQGGSAQTNLFSIHDNVGGYLAGPRTAFFPDPGSEDRWEVQPDLSIRASKRGFNFDATYKMARYKLEMKGEAVRFHGDGVYMSMYFVSDTDIENLWLEMDIDSEGLLENTWSVDGVPSGAFAGSASAKLRRFVLAEGYENQFCMQAAAKLPCKFEADLDENIVSAYVNVTGGRRVAAGVPFFFTARISKTDLRPSPYISVVHKLSGDTCERYGRYELAFQTMGIDISDPYDIANIELTSVVAGPYDQKFRIRPFYYVPCEETGEGDGRKVVKAGRPFFVARYSPRNAGKHYMRLYASRDYRHYSTPVLEFEAEQPSEPSREGFVIRCMDDERYFMLSSGESFFPVGQNLAWEEPSVPSAYEKALKKMATKGANATRVWQSSWGITFDNSDEPFGFDQRGMHVMDSYLEQCSKHGIKAILVLLNHEDLKNNRVRLPYFGEGMAVEEGEFFTNEQTLEMHRNRLAYIVNRYSPYNSLFAFETGNELDYSTDKETLTAWTRDTIAEIRRWDINRHLVTSSLGFNAFSSEFWKDTGADFAQVHGYFTNPAFLKAEYERSASKMAEHFANQAAGLGMPLFFSEFGYSESSESQSMNELDKRGVLIDNGQWASLFAGMSGGTLNWWWDTYVRPMGLEDRFSPFSKYLSNVRFCDEGFVQSSRDLGDASLSVLKGKTMILGRVNSTTTPGCRS
ncbi:MAG: cellulase family glycosylhydrolase [Planctomycetota bacterium]|nr:cellulase family glycosylhydrolase [Planctomycetota bacterium]